MASKIDTANAIAQDAGTWFVQSTGDGFWTTKRSLPIWQAQDIERRLIELGIEASYAPDHDDRSVAWVWATLSESDLDERLHLYAVRTGKDIGEDRAAGIRAMRDEPQEVADGVDCTADEVIAWCEAQMLAQRLAATQDKV